MRVCKIGNCGKPAEARDLCNAHYHKWRRGTLEPSKGGPCVIEGCGKPSRSGFDWCHSHAARYFAFGDPMGAAHGDTCEIDGCANRHRRKGLCSTHLKRKEVYGDVMAEMPVQGTEPSLPVEPFFEYADRRGGLTQALDDAGVILREREKVTKAIDRAKRQGYWTVSTADRIVIRIYGVHPFEVYGDEWWSREIHEDEAVAA